MSATSLVACAQQPSPAASSAAAVPAVAQSSAPQLVTGLPDFTGLVEQVGPAVVNVEATIGGKRSASTQTAQDDAIPEIFRRMLPPGFEFPDGQGDPRQQRRGTSLGSGFVISADGYVLTNHHVIDGADTVKVKLPDRREFTAKVVGSDEQYDVALLKIDAKGLPTVRLGDSKLLKSGQWVVAIGSPLGLDHSVTAGIVSAVGRTGNGEQRYVPFIQTDVAINQGNSGGPLLNTRGEVVGINSQIFSMSGGYMGISFAIPIDLAMSAVDQLKKNGRVSRGQLGVIVQAMSAEEAKGLGLPDANGALVNQVLEDSPAGKADLRPGDVIRTVDGRPINDSSELPPIIGSMAPGSKVRLGVWSGGKTRDVTLTLTELETDQLAADEDGQGPAAKPAISSGSNALGIVVEALDAASRKRLGLKAGEGVMITNVTNGATRDAGIGRGMVVLQVGREAVGSVAAFNAQVADVEDGDTVMLLVRQGSITRFLAVPVEADER
nr:DegQ family serine endoprotease [Pseudoxanthomonas dokdonensis]